VKTIRTKCLACGDGFTTPVASRCGNCGVEAPLVSGGRCGVTEEETTGAAKAFAICALIGVVVVMVGAGILAARAGLGR